MTNVTLKHKAFYIAFTRLVNAKATFQEYYKYFTSCSYSEFENIEKIAIPIYNKLAKGV